MELANTAFFALVEEQLASGLQVTIPLRGTSMRPLLHEGDSLVLSPLDNEPVVGDVILFRYHDSHRLHRIVGITNGTYTLQGDNCYGTETASRQDLLARLTEVRRADGSQLPTDSRAWQRLSRRALRRKRLRNLAIRWLGRRGRQQLRPWYFAALAFLMWAPLNGIGIPLNNYILGLRADHLLHASVFIPCSLFLMDLKRSHHASLLTHRLTVWLMAVAIGLLTEGVQYLLPYRGFDINDLVANTFGVTLGWAIILLVRHRLHRQR